MAHEPGNEPAATITLSPVEATVLTPRRANNSLSYDYQGQGILVSPVNTFLLGFKKQLQYVNALMLWFMDHAEEVHRWIIDANDDDLRQSAIRDLYGQRNLEGFAGNFPEFDEPGFDIEDPACRESVLTRRELLDYTAIDCIFLKYENKLISEACFGCLDPCRKNNARTRLLMEDYSMEYTCRVLWK